MVAMECNTYGLQRTMPLCVNITEDLDASWKSVGDNVLKTNGRSILSKWGRDILKDGLKDHVKTVLIEPSYICKDHRDLFSHYYSRKFNVNSYLCSRLHFFSEIIDNPLKLFDMDSDSRSESYLGYSVIRPVSKRCIGRTVIDPNKLKIGYGNSLFCLRTAFKTHIYGVTLTASGYPWMSQDVEAMVCAHSALWGLCRFLSERYTNYPEVHPFDLVRMTSTEDGRIYPRRGMVYNDYSRILTKFGTFPVIMRIKTNINVSSRDENEFRDMCTYIESGFPVLASVYKKNNDGGHVASVMGHTFDTSEINPDENELIDHTVFFKELVVVDDNAFPYQLLGSDVSTAKTDKYTLEDIHTAVCPLPEKVFLTADVARPIIEEYLLHSDILPRIKKIGNGPWVKRLFLATCYSFKEHKLKQAQTNPLSYDKNLDLILTLTRMPHFIWVMQIGPLDLYVNDQKCTAEIVLDATAGKDDKCLLYARVGKELILPGEDEPFRSESAEESFDLYCHNLGGQKT